MSEIMIISDSKPLAPATITEILDRTFRLYREHFVTYITVVAVVTVPIMLITTVISQIYLNQISGMVSFSARQAATNQYLLLANGVQIIASILQGVFVTGTLTYIVSENHLGRTITFGDAVQVIRGRYFPLGLGLFIFYLLMLVLAIASGIALVCLVGVLGFGLLIYLAITINAFLAPVIVLEGVGVSQGINRAWGLAKARFWPLFGLLAAVYIIMFVLGIALGAIQELIDGSILGASSLDNVSLVGVVLQTLLAVFIGPIAPVAMTLMYYDHRIRFEGLDIAMQAVNSPEPRPSDVESPPVRASLTGRDLRNILIIIGVLVVLFLVLGATAEVLIDALLRSSAGF